VCLQLPCGGQVIGEGRGQSGICAVDIAQSDCKSRAVTCIDDGLAEALAYCRGTEWGEMVVLFNVTAPVSAKNLPLTVEPPSSVIEA